MAADARPISEENAPLDSAPLPPPTDAAPIRGRHLLLLALTTVLALAPFLGKPVHLDDPMYLWAARRIQSHPLDPYGFTVNWRGWAEPMTTVMQNPPLVSYYLAGTTALFGWSAVALHAAMLPWAVLATVGTAVLAGRFCRRPIWAAVLAVATPAVFVSATTLMCEMPLLTLWVWALVLFDRGSTAASTGRAWALLLAAGSVASLAPLAKYPGINLIPLLALAAALSADRRRWLPQAVAVLMPVLALIAYDRLTAARYGVGLVVDAFRYTHSLDAHSKVGFVGRVVDLLCFIGGGGVAVAGVGLAVWLGRSRRPVLAIVAALLAVAVVGRLAIAPPPPGGVPGWFPHSLFYAELAAMAVAGGAVVGVCFVGLGSPWDRRGLLLLAWAGGVAVFAGFVNWAENVRSIVPMMPAAAILAVRAADRLGVGSVPRTLRLSTAAGVLLAVAVAVADCRFAAADCAAALAVSGAYHAAAAEHRAGRLWFGGHWGFQYYLQPLAGTPIDEHDPVSVYHVGDWVVLCSNNCCTRPPKVPLVAVETLTATRPWLTTMDESVGAGWYFSAGDRLPFVAGPLPPQAYVIGVVVPR